MSFLLCERHNKLERSGSNALTSGQICLDRECPQSYKVLCQSCKKDHRNHAIKLLSIEDVSFLLERLVKLPFKSMIKPIGQALNIINQLKHIKEFRKKIGILEEEIQREAITLIDQTETLLAEYNRCKDNAANLSTLFNDIDETHTFKEIIKNSKELLNGLQYNVKKDRFQYGNPFIKDMEEKRTQTAENAKQKIVEVRDYSMKIIEVILNNYEFDDEGEDLQLKHKQYDTLKEELCLERESNADKTAHSLIQSRSTYNKSEIKNQIQEKQAQTEHQLFTKQDLERQIEQKIAELNEKHLTIESEFKSKIQSLGKEKQSLSFQLAKWKQKFSEKQKSIRQIEGQLRGNRHTRNDKLKMRQDLVNNIIQIWNTKASDAQDSHL